MSSGLTSHQQRGHTETGPRFKVSSERPVKRGIDLAIPAKREEKNKIGRRRFESTRFGSWRFESRRYGTTL